jgi:hypothetical protein
MDQSTYFGRDTRAPSPRIWKDCPWSAIQKGDIAGYAIADDFLNPPTFATTVVQQGYYPFIGTSATIAPLATEVGGVMRITTPGSDNIEAELITGSGVAGMGKIASSSPKKLWFECRVRFGAITAQAAFIGLTQEQVPADNLMPDDGTLAIPSIDKVGFQVLEGDPDGLDAVHNDSTGDIIVQEVAQLLVATTWYKLGIYFDGLKTYWFVDNAQVGSGVLPTATDFPDGEELAFMIGLKEHEAVAKTLDLDWWRFAQLA